MEYLQITNENLEQEHIGCAISKNDDIQVASKKAWIRQCLDDGLVFLKGSERGKCLIEYIPAENAWIPLIADGYMYIDCFWVAGSLKGHGYSNDLLNQCIEDSKAKGKVGLCILSSPKKRPYLCDPKYLAYKGFQVADTSDIGIQLFYLPFTKDAVVPKFTEAARHPHIDEMGYVLYYTNQCPFNGKYVPIVEEVAKQHAIPFHAIHIETKQQAQSVPSPCTTYAMFYNGEFLTNEICNEARFLKLVQK